MFFPFFAVVSYLMIHKAPQGFLNCNRTWTSLETGMKAEEERKEEKEAAALTTFITDSCMQKGSPDEGELYKSPTIKEPPLDFDVVKNGTASTDTHTRPHTHTHTPSSAVRPVLISCC